MIKAILDKVVVKIHESPDVTPGGIYLPDKAKKVSQRATVVAVGPGAWVDGRRIVPEVSVGDEVIVSHYAVNKVTHEGEDYVVVQESDVLAVVEKNGKENRK